MKYDIFKEACATKETGPEYPQIQQWKTGYPEDRHDSYYAYDEASSNGRILPDFAPNLDSLILKSRAKPTDLLSSIVSFGFIVSKKLKSILEKSTLPPYKIYAAGVIHNKIKLADYYFFHLASDYYGKSLDSVDYTNSSFTEGDIGGGNSKPITLSSKEDYLSKSKDLQDKWKKKISYRTIFAEKIMFNEEHDQELDLFEAPFDGEYYISERLKKILFENAITGYEIKLL